MANRKTSARAPEPRPVRRIPPPEPEPDPGPTTRPFLSRDPRFAFGAVDRRVAVLAALVAFAVDVPRLAPTLSVQGDSAVFVSSAAMLGVPQPPGYPLYVLVGHLFAKLPFGDVAWRVHLTSAVFHAIAVGLVAAIAMRLGARRAAALGGALVLAFSQAFFLGSHYAEAFPLNDLFTALLLERAVAFWQAGAERSLSARRRDLVIFGGLVGLASTHHQMISLTAVALGLLLYAGGALPALRGRTALLGLAGFLAPLVVAYGALVACAARHPFSSWGDVHDLGSLARLVTRHDYGGLLSPHIEPVSLDASDLAGAWGEQVVRHFGVAMVAIAIVGAVVLSRRDRVAGLALASAVLIAGPLFATKNALRVDTEHGLAFAERFTTMSEVPVGVLVAYGLSSLADLARAHLPWPLLRLATGLAFLPPLVAHADATDLRHDRRGLALAHDLVDSAPDGAIVLITSDASNGAILYACGVERRCGDRRVFSPGQLYLDWRVAQLGARWPDLVIPARREGNRNVALTDLVDANLSARPVYVQAELLDKDPGLRDRAMLPQALLVRLLPDGASIVGAREDLVRSARALATSAGCEGCGIRRDALVWPSLETALPNLYAIAMINHARMLAAMAPRADGDTPDAADARAMLGLADALQARAAEIDEETARRFR